MDPLAYDATLNDVIERVPRLAQATQLHAASLSGGLSNANYLVTADGIRYVVRIANRDADLYGIDRWREGAALLNAAAAKIAPEPIEFLLPEGHMVSRYLSEARPLTMEEFTSQDTVPRVAGRLADIHRLDAVDGSFNPYDDIRRWHSAIVARGTAQPARLDPLLEQAAATEAERSGNYIPVLCHNDPCHRNFLDDGNLWVLDWEYAGMGDPMYDLGGAAYPLSAAGREVLIHSYFGGADPDVRRDLDRLIGVYLCWKVVWCLLHVDHSPADYDYAAFAEHLLDHVPAPG